MHSPLLDPLDLTLRIRKHILVEFEITPLKPFHPETIKMEHASRDVSFCHPVKETVHSGLIIICGKACAEPETESPGRWESRTSSNCRVLLDDVFWSCAMDEIDLKLFSGDGDVDSCCPWNYQQVGS